MESIDQKIDKMILGKLTSLIQENTVRIKKINIKFMALNKKHTVERLDVCYESYDRLLRGVSKELVRIEKSVREKFAEPISEERKTKVLSYINTEADLLAKMLEDDLRVEYKKFGKEELFVEKFDASLSKLKKNLEDQTQKLMKSMAENSGHKRGYQPAELSEIFEIDKTLLINMNFISPLTRISSVFEELNSDQGAQKVYAVVKEAIREMAKIALENPEGSADNMKERKARKMLAAKKSLSLGELVNNVQLLAEQLSVPQDMRNMSVVDKVWSRLENSLKESDDGEKLLPGLKLFYDYLNSPGN